jgi:uncharacterized repeat protein (TIGR03803 family)
MKNTRVTISSRIPVAAATISFVLMASMLVGAQTYTPLHSYPAGNGIGWPGVMSQGPDGQLYDTMATYGTYNLGSAFKISTSGTYTQLYSFCGEGWPCVTTGANPQGGLTFGSDGNLYGTTQSGGPNNYPGAGTIFKLTPDGAYTKLWYFTDVKDQGYPSWGVVEGQDGNYYGVNPNVYVGTYGAFYKMTPKGVVTAWAFNFTDGASANLPTQALDKSFYGTTQAGGSPTCNCGVVYKATTAGKITVLHTFVGGATDGSRPAGALVQGNDGNFYGTTFYGGTYNKGTIFKITSKGVFTLLYSFGGFAGDGVYAISGLTLGTDGNFYGTTLNGGKANAGLIYQVNTTGNVSILYSFCSKTCNDGFGSNSPLVQHTDGLFYGNTDGNSLGGSVFFSLDMGLKPFIKTVLWSGKVGTTVQILGQGFTTATNVSFNGGSAAFKVVSDTYMTATIPATGSTGNVTVTTSAGTLTSNRAFYVIPVVTTFTPASGPVGTAVTITGKGFLGATKVTIGGKAAKFTVNSGTQITATVPTGAVTSKKIAVTTPGGAASSPATFTVTP